MNYVIITAGGSGTRMNSTTPKQFMDINGKPLIVYTLEKFGQSKYIDEIVISCLDGWQHKISEYIQTYKLNKITTIVSGGNSGQQSIFNGYQAIKDRCDNDSNILIHDGNRPNVNDTIIKNGIDLCKEKGNAIAYIPCQEVMFVTDDFISSTEQIDRSKLARTQTPHVFKKKVLDNIFNYAKEANLNNEPAICSLMQKAGMTTYLYEGDEKNIKITFKSDIEIFKALIGIDI